MLSGHPLFADGRYSLIWTVQEASAAGSFILFPVRLFPVFFNGLRNDRRLGMRFLPARDRFRVFERFFLAPHRAPARTALHNDEYDRRHNSQDQQDRGSPDNPDDEVFTEVFNTVDGILNCCEMRSPSVFGSDTDSVVSRTSSR